MQKLHLHHKPTTFSMYALCFMVLAGCVFIERLPGNTVMTYSGNSLKQSCSILLPHSFIELSKPYYEKQDNNSTQISYSFHGANWALGKISGSSYYMELFTPYKALNVMKNPCSIGAVKTKPMKLWSDEEYENSFLYNVHLDNSEYLNKLQFVSGIGFFNEMIHRYLLGYIEFCPVQNVIGLSFRHFENQLKETEDPELFSHAWTFADSEIPVMQGTEYGLSVIKNSQLYSSFMRVLGTYTACTLKSGMIHTAYNVNISDVSCVFQQKITYGQIGSSVNSSESPWNFMRNMAVYSKPTENLDISLIIEENVETRRIYFGESFALKRRCSVNYTIELPALSYFAKELFEFCKTKQGDAYIKSTSLQKLSIEFLPVIFEESISKVSNPSGLEKYTIVQSIKYKKDDFIFAMFLKKSSDEIAFEMRADFPLFLNGKGSVLYNSDKKWEWEIRFILSDL